MAVSPRPYLIEEYTQSVCPQCFAEGQLRSDDPRAWCDAMLVSHDNSVWLRRWCATHGATESLYEEDLALWRARAGWSTPTSHVIPDRAGNAAPFPYGYRDGLPQAHGQHTCILVLNITDRCNYGCMTCYASAKSPGTPVPRHERPDIADVLRTVQVVIEREGGALGVLMLSGGEPTVREDLPQLIEALLPLPINRVMINTNGRRIARDGKFLDFLTAHRDRVEVYLQFDGVKSSTYQTLRGEDVAQEKLCALERLNERGIWTTLVTTVTRGVNEDELGDVLQLALNTPRVSGWAIQPVFGSGRHAGFDPLNRATPTGVLSRLGAQSGGVLQADDFVPLPCSHKDCCDISYMLKLPSGEWKSLPKLLGRDELKNWIHLAANTIAFEDLRPALSEVVKSGALTRVFSEQLRCGTPRLALDLGRLCDCVPGVPEVLGALWDRALKRHEASAMQSLAERTLRITVKMFMDAHTLHAARLKQCCVHTGTFEADPRRYSFCWRWLFSDATDFPDEMPQAGFVPLEQLAAR